MRLLLLRDCVLKDSISVWFPTAREWRYMTVEQFRQYRTTQQLRELRHG